LYIVFEGVDGSGKSTQVGSVKELLEEKLKEMYKYNRNFLERLEVMTIAEPEIEGWVNEDDPVEQVLRFALQRRILTYRLDVNPRRISPVIISDRSYYSSMAYQSSILSGMSYPEHIREVNEFIPTPNMVFFFDNGIPSESRLFFTYRKYFEVLPLSTIYVNTEKYNIEETTEYIVNKIIEYIQDKNNILF